MNHELKCWPPYWDRVAKREKLFEVRVHDRDYQAGDILTLKEWSPHPEDRTKGRYTGGVLTADVTYVLRGGGFGIANSHCVLSLGEIVVESWPEEQR